jgi:hypothetical protein
MGMPAPLIPQRVQSGGIETVYVHAMPIPPNNQPLRPPREHRELDALLSRQRRKNGEYLSISNIYWEMYDIKIKKGPTKKGAKVYSPLAQPKPAVMPTPTAQNSCNNPWA